MKKLIIIAAVALSGCATVLTPERCAGINAAAMALEDVAALLEAQGIEPVRAHKLAVLVKAGNETLQAACAQANAHP